MENSWHSLASLFDQLGLESSEQAIDAFVAKHGPLSGEVNLHQATFWTRSQASFLREGTEQDADWTEIIDQLDSLLREAVERA
jgi:hypothetical protein